MKKTILAIIMLFVCSNAYAAGTCTITGTSKRSSNVTEVVISCTADATDASFPSVNVNGYDGYVMAICIDEGSTTTDGTITMSLKMDSTDVDLLGANGTGINTTGGYACITPANINGDNYLAPFTRDLDFQITGGGVNSANPVVYILYGE